MTQALCRPTLGAMALAWLLAVPLVAVLVPRDGSAMAALFPGRTPEQAALLVVGADGTPIGAGRVPGLVLVLGEPGLRQRLAAAGATLVIAAPWARGCVTRTAAAT